MSTILDSYGRAAVYEGTQDQAGLRPWRPHSDKDIKELMNYRRWRGMLSDCRWLATAFPDLGGAIRQKRDYVSKGTWTPQFRGEDKDWGKQATTALLTALKIIEPRGRPYTWERSMRIACTSLDIDGDFLILKGRHKRSGYPFLQWIPAHRVGTRTQGETIKGGRYDGATIRNGLVYDRRQSTRILAFHLLGTKPAHDRFIDAKDIIYGIDPVWMDQGRGIPTVGNSILDLYDIKTTRENEKLAQSINSSIALVETNSTGTAPDFTSRNNATTGGVTVEDVLPGVKAYVKKGGSLQAFASSRPSDQWQRFDETIMRGSMIGINWRVEMLDLSKLTGAAVRGFADNINTVIDDRWRVMTEIAHPAIVHVVMGLIDIGLIPSSDEFWNWGFQHPPKFTVDIGRERAQSLEDARAGRTSISQLIRDDGRDPEEVEREIADEVQRRNQLAADRGIKPEDIGTLSKPGDVSTQETPAESTE